MKPIPEQWAKQAQYDLETARAMLASGRYLYVLFCCQQAVEKMLKALIAKREDELPPRVHNLMQLATRAGLSLETAQADFLRQLSAFYIQTRYPEEMEALSGEVAREMALSALQKSEEMIRWLSSIK